MSYVLSLSCFWIYSGMTNPCGAYSDK